MNINPYLVIYEESFFLFKAQITSFVRFSADSHFHYLYFGSLKFSLFFHFVSFYFCMLLSSL